MQRTSPVVLNLIIINTLVFFAQSAFGDTVEYGELINRLALYPLGSGLFQPYQILTYMFLHGGLMHLLLNMLGLWMFGSLMERVWGMRHFILYYLICGLAAGVAQLLLSDGPAVGASGAIMGILVAYAFTFPDTQLFIMPIPFPIKAKWAVTGIIVIDLISGLSDNAGDNIAHFAHLGGALTGFLLMLFWKPKTRNDFF